MNIGSKLDFGWLYLVSGLALIVSAIVIPANQELTELQNKRDVLVDEFDSLQTKAIEYSEFLELVQSDDPVVRKRIIDLQFNTTSDEEIVVVDNSSVRTPLEWLSQKSTKRKPVNVAPSEASVLSALTTGKSRLVLFGVGAFTMFIGLVSKPRAC